MTRYKFIRLMVVMSATFILCGALTTILKKAQLPTTTVFNDQANTFSTGIQSFPANGATPAGIKQVLAGSTGAPSSGTHAAGEHNLDSSGDLYVCTVAGTPGTWQKIGPGSGVNVTVNGNAHGSTSTLQLNAGSNVTVTSATSGGTTGVTVTAANFNAVINGDMLVAQRGTSFASPSSATYTLDRWTQTNVGAAVYTITQSSEAPTVAQAGRKITTSFKLATTTADSSVAATDRVSLVQPIEGYRWKELSGKQTTLSFWVRSEVTGTFCVALRNSAVDRSCVQTYTIFTADAWEFKTVTFPAEPSGTFLYTAGIGVYLDFVLMCGSTFGSATAGNWASGVNYIATSAQANLVATSGNDFYLTGVQLEPGYVATPVISRGYSTELSLCSRYYQRFNREGSTFLWQWYSGSTLQQDHYFTHTFPVVMRAAPTATLVGTWATLNINIGPQVGTNSVYSFWLYARYNSASTATYFTMDTSDDVLTFEAEL